MRHAARLQASSKSSNFLFAKSISAWFVTPVSRDPSVSGAAFGRVRLPNVVCEQQLFHFAAPRHIIVLFELTTGCSESLPFVWDGSDTMLNRHSCNVDCFTCYGYASFTACSCTRIDH